MFIFEYLVPYWTSEEVCAWLSSIGMSEYGSTFRKNDIQGSELMHLERSDIMDIGITKIGHVKRLQVREKLFYNL